MAKGAGTASERAVNNQTGEVGGRSREEEKESGKEEEDDGGVGGGGVGPSKWEERGRERGAEGRAGWPPHNSKADVGCDEE